MELTLNLPDELADRLPLHEDQLALVLELGLQVLRAEEDEGESALPPGWRAALMELLRRRRDSRGESPTVPELLAYYRNELEPEAEDDLLERLILHPQAARDLLDLIEFEAPDASDTETNRPASAVLQAFRARVADLEDREASHGEPSEEPVDPLPPSRAKVIPFPQRPFRWVGWAAALLLAVGSLWMVGHPGPGASLDYATVIEVTASRGARSFPVSEKSQEILIVLPRAESAQIGQGILRIFSPRGEVIYEEDFFGREDPWSRLYVKLPRAGLGAGTYRIEISRGSPNTEVREYWFTIQDPPPP